MGCIETRKCRSKKSLMVAVTLVMVLGTMYGMLSSILIYQLFMVKHKTHHLAAIDYISTGMEGIGGYILLLIMLSIILTVLVLATVIMAPLHVKPWFNIWPTFAAALSGIWTVLGGFLVYIRLTVPSFEQHKGLIVILMMQSFDQQLNLTEDLRNIVKAVLVEEPYIALPRGPDEFEKFRNFTADTVNELQKEFKCCGIGHYSTWLMTPWFMQVGSKHQKIKTVPTSCCKSDDCGQVDKPNPMNKIFEFLKVYTATGVPSNLERTIDTKDITQAAQCVKKGKMNIACYVGLSPPTRRGVFSTWVSTLNAYKSVVAKNQEDQLAAYANALRLFLPEIDEHKIQKTSCDTKLLNWYQSYILIAGIILLTHGFLLLLIAVASWVIRINRTERIVFIHTDEARSMDRTLEDTHETELTQTGTGTTDEAVTDVQDPNEIKANQIKIEEFYDDAIVSQNSSTIKSTSPEETSTIKVTEVPDSFALRSVSTKMVRSPVSPGSPTYDTEARIAASPTNKMGKSSKLTETKLTTGHESSTFSSKNSPDSGMHPKAGFEPNYVISVRNR